MQQLQSLRRKRRLLLGPVRKVYCKCRDVPGQLLPAIFGTVLSIRRGPLDQLGKCCGSRRSGVELRKLPQDSCPTMIPKASGMCSNANQ